MKSVSFNLSRSFVLVLGLFVFVSGCGRDPKKTTYDFAPPMNDSPALKAQKLDENGFGMRMPPAGTIHRDAPPIYRFTDIANAMDLKTPLQNPLPRSRDVLLKGKEMFNTYCIVCHGARGEGNGSIVPKFPMPPSLQSDKIRNFADGQIYHVITMGQNLMGSYASQVLPEDRWAIIHYIRVLQRSLNPTEADVNALKAVKAGN